MQDEGPNMANELDRLERRAQEVRGQLALDLDELFLRLQPRQIARNIALYARETQVGDGMGRDSVRDMRRNPIPYLLVGIGIAGLVWAISSISRSRTRGRLPEFSEADFVPPPSPRATPAPAVAPATPAATAASAIPTAATRPVSPATPAAAREISPVTSEER
jgi:hypothetical protein